jgi:hypothetical protein
MHSHSQANIFLDPLSSYKHKDDLIILSGTLGLKTVGTVPKLTNQVKSYLSSHPEIQLETRFSGLFSHKRRHLDVDNH